MDFAEGHEGFVVGFFGFDVREVDLVVMDGEFFAGVEDDLFVGDVL